MLSSVFSSCESIDGPDPPRPTADLILQIEYIGLDGFIGDISRIVVFVTDNDKNYISCKADEIKDSFIATVSPGKYVVSAEYITPDTNDANIVLDSFTVELGPWQNLEKKLTINLYNIKYTKQQSNSTL